jgi:hypothetical protein
MLGKNSSMHTWAPAACSTCTASSMLACSSSMHLLVQEEIKLVLIKGEELVLQQEDSVYRRLLLLAELVDVELKADEKEEEDESHIG